MPWPYIAPPEEPPYPDEGDDLSFEQPTIDVEATDPEVISYIYGPDGEPMWTFVDRRTVPFGFCPREQEVNMRVTLAVPYDGHKPDDTITVDDRTGRQLIRDGRARLPGVTDLGSLRVPELRAYAAKHKVDLGSARKKADILAAIETAQTRATSTTTVLSPATGADNEEA